MITTMTTTPEKSKKTMKAVQGKELGDIDEMLTVDDDVPFPNLDDLPQKKKKTRMIIQTKAVALA